MPTIVCPLWKIVNGLLIYQNYQRWCAQASFYKLRIRQIINCEFPQVNYQLQIYRVIKDGMHSRLKWNYWSDWLKKKQQQQQQQQQQKNRNNIKCIFNFQSSDQDEKNWKFFVGLFIKKTWIWRNREKLSTKCLMVRIPFVLQNAIFMTQCPAHLVLKYYLRHYHPYIPMMEPIGIRATSWMISKQKWLFWNCLFWNSFLSKNKL